MNTRYFVLMSIVGLVIACNELSSTKQHQFSSETGLVERNFDAAQIKRGETVYLANCTACHGPNGEAKPDWRKPGADGRYPPPPLNGTAHTWHHSTEALKRTILNGGPPSDNGLPSAMPAWKGKLTEQQVDDILVWIKSLWPNEIYDAWYRNIERKQ
tara:strand:+ start:1858 stop:2328 length:471 start_codon:yes stop_codon:yes gene_type:complete